MNLKEFVKHYLFFITESEIILFVSLLPFLLKKQHVGGRQ
jgi:hypothetical protein